MPDLVTPFLDGVRSYKLGTQLSKMAYGAELVQGSKGSKSASSFLRKADTPTTINKRSVQ